MDPAAFASRFVQSDDVPFIASSFAGSYIKAGHIGGMRDVFQRFFARPFGKLVQASATGPSAVVSTLVVYPIAEPTEIAGYAVYSPLHSCLVYLLVKTAYAGRRVAAFLLSQMPRLNSETPRDSRPYFHNCFSTIEFAKMTQHLEVRTRYSPMMFQRLLEEISEGGEA